MFEPEVLPDNSYGRQTSQPQFLNIFELSMWLQISQLEGFLVTIV